MSLACSRFLFFMASAAAALALGIASYLEYAVGLTPCSLCVLQRLCLVLFLVNGLAACVHGPGRKGSILYGVTGLVSVSGGMALAWRQVLLQSHSPDCLTQVKGAGSWWSAMRQVLDGAVDCAGVTWTLFDLSIPEWSLLFFLAISIAMTYLLLRLVWTALIRPLGDKTSQFVRVTD
ncbi:MULTISPECIES: disulfide bond formation protein B [unclassified Pseudomonas]|jgi:disulfide bond formation protein DsbB|uniref:disulfide bond formation protein B n=1 Tax=unclassified Pseudomonas TaxID=196821 RepID=UPI00119A51E6|nr:MULTISPECIES: disulfide bond formation protein B [unclassified Pseudomonas]TWC12203.1 disulfide bond formation protein DsbB [Pseudomonas sp. SJZ074]TWC17416.1 disulfide bond formation protein DsbB [Pseudomonas sp. SJZ075]TWC30787.1 disulfide bond formation protein DsbB [Pseudomonas sp. SJZ085]TWC33827.1 disulfide bond formation protein DsbB [Pseudomonas sp. SJZ078]TWC54779.1 disulfide bond formation protein DsbB [Pseudomonas sp. SJZ124]